MLCLSILSEMNAGARDTTSKWEKLFKVFFSKVLTPVPSFLTGFLPVRQCLQIA